eukprot:GHVR01037687.1.p1 GENE.GHVR01037687.1~~GHVR01037687.1.p1  ORF type:complete len:133 (-),score=0.10 GHVR01037687.1:515-913(-)
MFLIKNILLYKSTVDRFDSFFEELINCGVIKSSSSEKNDFFSPEIIFANYNRFDAYYRKKLDFSKDLDERIFFKDRAANLTPSRFTPFSRQGYVTRPLKNNGTKLGNFPNWNDGTVNRENFNSNRILNYDLI